MTIEEIQEKALLPENFGPKFWDFLHLYSFINRALLSPYTMDKFLTFIYEGIPCEKCQNHMKEFLEENPYTIEKFLEEYGAVKYILELHNHAASHSGGEIYTFDKLVGKIHESMRS